MSDEIENLPPLREIIEMHDLRAEKSLGQNFLLDLNLTSKIARSAGSLEGRQVIEVGPGPGGLTRAILLNKADRLTAIEFDDRAVKALESLRQAANGRLEIIKGDALKFNVSEFETDKPIKIIANLPYNIATVLLTGWLEVVRNHPDKIESMTLMFQKEVADRITAKPSCKEYGRISVLANWLCKTSKVVTLPPNAFTPPPKIHSAVVHFEPRKLEGRQPEFHNVEKITQMTFGQRRKMLRKTLSGYVDKLEELGIDPTKRPEDLEVEGFINLANLL